LLVVDMTRLAPGPYGTMLLADLGADVIVVGGGRAGFPIPEFSRGKRHINLDLKNPAGISALLKLLARADVFIEGFRPGVADRLGFGFKSLSIKFPKLVYCSLTGYGQDGPRAQDAGHDINYLAATGVLGALGPGDRPPYPPLNIVADFAGGGMVAALGIMAAILERQKSGLGQFVDVAMVDGCLSLMAMHFPLWKTRHFPERGDGLIAGNSPMYSCYACADGRYVSVGALEKPFFLALWAKLDLGDAPDHMDTGQWPRIRALLTEKFASRPRDEWAEHFIGSDACVVPVLAPDEVWSEAQNAYRHPSARSDRVPALPRLSRSPSAAREVDMTERSAEVLAELGLTPAEIAAASVPYRGTTTGLTWPPELKS
jgi:alpha-methylacyl-CoA racemase